MPGAFSSRLIEEVGPVDGYIHIDPMQLRTATTLNATTFAVVLKYEPWTHVSTAALLAFHPVAVWRNLTANVSSREGAHGRMITIYCGWANNNMPAPTTVSGMRQLKGAFSKTFGGTGDPGMFSMNIPAPFDGTMTDTLKTPYNAGVRAVFYYCFVETNLTTSPPDADRCVIEFDGHYDVFGRY